MPPRAKTLRGQKPRPSRLTFLSHVVQQHDLLRQMKYYHHLSYTYK